jgi:hypothetical protein
MNEHPPDPHPTTVPLVDPGPQDLDPYRREWAREVHLDILQSIPNDELTDDERNYYKSLREEAERADPSAPPARKKAKSNGQRALARPVSKHIPWPRRKSKADLD